MVRDHRLQLAALRDIAHALDESGIVFWLFGGWAVDFAVGKVTRQHDDIDLVLLEDDLDRAIDCLCGRGYTRTSSRQAHQTNLDRQGLRVQLNIVKILSDGTVVSPGAFSDWPWHPSSLKGSRGSVGGLELRIVSPQSMLETKQGFPQHPSGSPHREKDLHDIRILGELLRDA